MFVALIVIIGIRAYRDIKRRGEYVVYRVVNGSTSYYGKQLKGEIDRSTGRYLWVYNVFQPLRHRAYRYSFREAKAMAEELGASFKEYKPFKTKKV